MTSDSQIERMIETFETALVGRPNYAIGMIGLAELVASKKCRLRAFELCQKARGAAPGDAEVLARARRLLSSLVPRYHVPMINDSRRNAAWQEALAKRVRPGTRALEIGTGAGMLALMAARAGAELVTTCERHPVLAAVAREMVQRNGLAACIDVIEKPSQELRLGQDIAQRADLLFCDIFGDSLVDLAPIGAIADARRRLTKPDAAVIPAAGSIRLALAEWKNYPMRGHVDRAAGFDLTAFSDFVPSSLLVAIGDDGLMLRSQDVQAFRYDFSRTSPTRQDRTEVLLRAHADAVVNGIIHWLRLELDDDIVLETRPEPGATYFLPPRFWPLPKPLSMRRGDGLRVGIAHGDKQLTIWPIG